MRRALLSVASFAVFVGCSDAPPPGLEVGTTQDALSQTVGATVLGVDVNVTLDAPLDFNKLKSEGYLFAIIKATEAGSSLDFKYKQTAAAAKAAGLIVGPYHFFRGNHDGVDQAKQFLAAVGTLAPEDLPASLDLETTDGATGAEITQRMNDFLHYVEQQTGKTPIVYTYSSYLSGAGVNTAGLAKYPLWLAPAHNFANSFDTGQYSVPWSKATIWQFDSNTPLGGITNSAADRDKFIGTIDDLKAFASGSQAAAALPHVNGNDTMSVLSWPSDGHVEVYVSGTDGTSQHVWTEGNTTTWNKPASYDGKAGCGLASAIHGGVAEVFAPGTKTQEAHVLAGGGWSAFADFGGTDLARLSAVVAADGHPEVYGLGADGAIQANAYDLTKKAWGGWKPIGGKVATGAAPIVHTDGTIEIFATDSAGAAWHAVETKGTWGAWKSIGGQLASRPVPLRYPDGHVEVFARGTDGFTYALETGAFTKIEATTAIEGEISAIMNTDARPELFARGADGTVVHMYWDFQKTAWTSWMPLGSPHQAGASDPLGWVRADGTADVFVVDPSGSLTAVHRGSNLGWGAWNPIASGIDTCADAAAPPPPSGDHDAGPGAADDAATPKPGSSGDPSATNDGTFGSGKKAGCACAIEETSAPHGAWLALVALVGLGARRRSKRT